MASTVSLVNMKGGVGKTTVAFNLAWYSAWTARLRVLAVDLDPQSTLSQYFMGDKNYLAYIQGDKGTVVDIFEQPSAPKGKRTAPRFVDTSHVIERLQSWDDYGGLIDLIPSRLELSWTLKNPTEKAHLLPRFLAQVSEDYDLIMIDCPPTESILTTAAYRSSRYVVVPVKPELLAAVGLPLLARSLAEFALAYEDQDIEIAGILFSDCPAQPSRQQQRSRKAVKEMAKRYKWPVFENEERHSDSYPRGSRESTPIGWTDYARGDVQNAFQKLGEEFVEKVGLKGKSA